VDLGKIVIFFFKNDCAHRARWKTESTKICRWFQTFHGSSHLNQAFLSDRSIIGLIGIKPIRLGSMAGLMRLLPPFSSSNRVQRFQRLHSRCLPVSFVLYIPPYPLELDYFLAVILSFFSSSRAVRLRPASARFEDDVLESHIMFLTLYYNSQSVS
jgi:hypothetical protein